MVAPFNDSWLLKRASNSSAGGQLEHPSEVNNSTMTAFLCAGPVAGLTMKAPSSSTNPSSNTPCLQESEFFMHHSFSRPCQNKSIAHCGIPLASIQFPLRTRGIFPGAETTKAGRPSRAGSRYPRWGPPQPPVPHCELPSGPQPPSARHIDRQFAIPDTEKPLRYRVSVHAPSNQSRRPPSGRLRVSTLLQFSGNRMPCRRNALTTPCSTPDQNSQRETQKFQRCPTQSA